MRIPRSLPKIFSSRYAANGYYLRKLSRFEVFVAHELCEKYPLVSVFVKSSLEQWNFLNNRVKFFGLFRDDGEMIGVCVIDVNISLFCFNEPGIKLLRKYFLRHKLVSQNQIAVNSIVGESDSVLPLWNELQDLGWQAKEVRTRQWVMKYSQNSESDVNYDAKYDVNYDANSAYGANLKDLKDLKDLQEILRAAKLRIATLADYEIVLPAAVQMFVEEIGFDPTEDSDSYEKYLRNQIRAKRIYIQTQVDAVGAEKVIFKADLGILTNSLAQIQGVWTAPDLRGNGIASVAVKSVAQFLKLKYRCEVCLYVNDFNFSALRSYENAGFEICGTFSTVIF